MMSAKRSAGVAPEVNLRNLMHVGDEAYKWRGGVHSCFETVGRCHQKFITWESVVPQKRTEVGNIYTLSHLITFLFQVQTVHQSTLAHGIRRRSGY